MPGARETLIRTIEVLQYDGTNSSEITDWVAPYTSNGYFPTAVQSEIDGTLILYWPGSDGGAGSVTINQMDWVGPDGGTYSPAQVDGPMFIKLSEIQLASNP